MPAVGRLWPSEDDDGVGGGGDDDGVPWGPIKQPTHSLSLILR